MTKIYLVRHGEAEGNLYRRCQGWYDSLLTKKAVEKQLPALRERFSDVRLDAVYSSDILRAHSTVRPIADEHGLELIPEPGLREINLGEWEDRPWGELPRLYPEEMDAWDHRPWEVRVPGGETYEQVERRLKGTLLRIAEKHDGGTVLAGSHGVATRSVLCMALYGSLRSLDKLRWCDNTAVNLLTVENGKISVDFYNDNSHLGELCSTLATQKWWRDSDEPADFHMWFRPVDLKTDAEEFLTWGKAFHQSAYGESAAFDAGAFLRESGLLQKEHPRALLFAMLRERVSGLLRLDAEALREEGCGLVRTVIVDEKLRGKGFSSQLLGEAVSAFRKASCRSIAANVADGNERAMGFYRKHGFLSAGEIPGHTVMKKSIEVKNPLRA